MEASVIQATTSGNYHRISVNCFLYLFQIRFSGRHQNPAAAHDILPDLSAFDAEASETRSPDLQRVIPPGPVLSPNP